jgi:hypothetical protein
LRRSTCCTPGSWRCGYRPTGRASWTACAGGWPPPRRGPPDGRGRRVAGGLESPPREAAWRSFSWGQFRRSRRAGPAHRTRSPEAPRHPNVPLHGPRPDKLTAPRHRRGRSSSDGSTSRLDNRGASIFSPWERTSLLIGEIRGPISVPHPLSGSVRTGASRQPRSLPSDLLGSARGRRDDTRGGNVEPPTRGLDRRSRADTAVERRPRIRGATEARKLNAEVHCTEPAPHSDMRPALSGNPVCRPWQPHLAEDRQG